MQGTVGNLPQRAMGSSAQRIRLPIGQSGIWKSMGAYLPDESLLDLFPESEKINF